MTMLLIFLSILCIAFSTYAQSNALVQRSDVRTFAATSTVQENPQPQPQPDLSNEYELLDVVLVASVDGKFHALSRTSGETLWSMSSIVTTTSVSAPSSLAPLVRTVHIDHDPEFMDEPTEDAQETYIIEPQTGEIFVMATPSSPLVRFPFTMPELVNIAPFTSMDKNDTRVFVGEKKTSLLLMELETGKIKATLNSECPIPEQRVSRDVFIDLDELEDAQPQISAPTEIYIGRTDYHITVIRDGPPGSPTTPVQNLAFSVYGPNNRDHHLQSMYKRTNDNIYVQSLPSGELISFKALSSDSRGAETEQAGQPLWLQNFGAPIVAIFDLLQPLPDSQGANSRPFALLQPRPKLHELFPSLHPTYIRTHTRLLPNIDSAYIGLVEESGSLFLMSPETYPLVAFGGSESGLRGLKGRKSRKMIDPSTKNSPGTDDSGSTTSVDEITRQRKERDEEQKLHDACLLNPYDKRCLVGIRKVEDGDGHERRMQRALDGPSGTRIGTGLPPGSMTPGRWPEPHNDNVIGDPSGSQSENASGGRLDIGNRESELQPGFTTPRLEAVLITAILGLVSVVLLWRRVKVGFKARWRSAMEQKSEVKLIQGPMDIVKPVGEDPLDVPASIPLPSTPSSNVTLEDQSKETDITPRSTPQKVVQVPDPIELKRPNTPKPTDAADEEGEGTEGEGDVQEATPTTPAKRRVRRGGRGKKKKNVTLLEPNEGGSGGSVAQGKDKEEEKEADAPQSSLVLTSSPKPPPMPSLIVSDTILGRGSHGTVVLQGSLQGRAVAVKRLLQDFVTLAAREVSILQESDDHPNVVRYYYQEAHGNFLYIALELCVCSLADIIEQPNRDVWRDIAVSFDPKKALRQVASGLRHLHALKLIHRDIKPQNILISSSKSSSNSFSTSKNGTAYRMLISDFGLCKKLDVDQTSFLPTAHGAMAAGSVGWRAPEILRGDVKLDDVPNGEDGSFSSRGSTATINGSSSNNGTAGRTRLTKSVDIFALGCLFYYTLTNGSHPYGDRIEREVNIMKNVKDLDLLDRFGEEGTEAKDLINAMLNPEAKLRPDTTTCLLHPFFWDSGRRLNFLQDASDRFEILCRDPKDQHLLTLENNALSVVGHDWHSRLDKIFIDNLGKYRKYDGKLVQDLLRALRNKKHHYQDLPDNVKRHLGSMPEGFLAYFTRRYPQLILHVHGVIKETGFSSESMFRSYFELPDS